MNIPSSILNSGLFSEEDLALLASITELPVINPAFTDERLKNIVQYYSINPVEMERELHTYAAELLKEGKLDDAWQILLSADNI